MSKKTGIITLIMGVAIFAGAALFFLPQTQAEDVLKIPPPINVEQAKPQSSVFYTTPIADTEFATDEIVILVGDNEKLFFDVELALTAPEQARGLMFRTEMPAHMGMLFMFDDVAMRSFWMKNTLIPLDMLFIHADGTIHHIHHNAKPQDLTSITSKYPSKAVLELNGGTADKMGIKEGDQVVHPYFRNGAGAQ